MTVPGYNALLSEVVDIVRSIGIKPRYWIDTGCGTGNLASRAISVFDDTQFIFADPSPEMISAAKKKMNGNMRCSYVTKGTEQLSMGDETIDVISAVLCHHYYGADERKTATENCYRLLKEGGAYITIEHVKHSDDSAKISKERWKLFLMDKGRTEEEAEGYLSRFGTVFFPIAAEEHIALLKECGFRTAGMFWYTCSDVGVYGIK